MPLPKRETIWRRAWRDTETSQNLGREAWAAVVGFLAVVASDLGDLLAQRGDAIHTLSSGLIGAAVAAILLPSGEFAYNLFKAKERIDADRAPLEELWRYIEADVRLHGPQLLSLSGLGRISTLGERDVSTKAHVRALDLLVQSGDVQIKRRVPAMDTETGEFSPDVWFEPAPGRFD